MTLLGRVHGFFDHLQARRFQTHGHFRREMRKKNDNGKSTSSYIIMISNGSINFTVGIQGLTAQFTMEAKLVAAALTMKEAVFCSNMMLELGFKEGFGSVLLYIDSKSALHIAGNRPHIKPSREAHRAEVLLCTGISGGG